LEEAVPEGALLAEALAPHLQRAREISLASYVRKRLAMGKTVQHGKGWQNRRAEPPLIGLA